MDSKTIKKKLDSCENLLLDNQKWQMDTLRQTLRNYNFCSLVREESVIPYSLACFGTLFLTDIFLKCVSYLNFLLIFYLFLYED